MMAQSVPLARRMRRYRYREPFAGWSPDWQAAIGQVEHLSQLADLSGLDLQVPRIDLQVTSANFQGASVDLQVASVSFQVHRTKIELDRPGELRRVRLSTDARQVPGKPV